MEEASVKISSVSLISYNGFPQFSLLQREDKVICFLCGGLGSFKIVSCKVNAVFSRNRKCFPSRLKIIKENIKKY